ncbi:MAG: peptidylprolyl isomerase [Myxococcota bacterium]
MRMPSHLVVVLASTLVGCASAGPAAWRVAEDRRDPDLAVFMAAVHEPDAVRALGRMASPELVPAVLAALDDPRTRALAAWAIGEYGVVDGFEPTSAVGLIEALVARERDPDPAVRAAVAVAYGRLRAESGARALVADPDPRVRAAAAEGLFWLGVLAQRMPDEASVAALVALGADPDKDVRRAVALAFSRRVDARAEALLATLAAEPGDTGMFATRGLGRLTEQAPATVELLARLARDGERAVRIEATLALHDAARVPAADAREPDLTLRAARAMKTGQAAADEPSGWVRALAVEQRSAKAFDAAALKDADARVRAAATAGIAQAGDGWRAAFEGAWADADLRVRLAALDALGKVTAPDAEARLRELLASLPADPTLRGAAVEAAVARKSKALAPDLAAVAARSPEPSFVEVRETIVDGLAELEAWELLAPLAQDAAPSVRAKAARAIAQHEGRAAPPLDRRLPAPSPYLGAHRAQRIALETDEGTVVIALDGALAPTTAAAITALVERGFYDGTTFHRLVPNFVLQGGDPTGTGWGDAGFQLRDEVSEAPFDVGAVGLAKSGPDTGSCQLFVMLAPAPHLAGRYTRLGRVVSGLDVVLRLELGDVIRRARALD